MPDDRPSDDEAPDAVADDLPPLDEPEYADGASGAATAFDPPDDAAPALAPSLPHNLEAEQALLGALLLSPRQFDAVEGRVDEADFFAPAHAAVFSAMAALSRRGQPLDALLLREELMRAGDLERIGGAAGLGNLLNVAASGAHVEHYARVVREKAMLRRLIESSTEIIEKATASQETAPEILDFAERSVFEVATRGVSADARPLEYVLDDLWKRLAPLDGEGPRGVTGVPTGYLELDELTAGLHGDELVIVAGRPSMGKSTFALNVLRNVALRENRPCAFFTLEMSSVNLAQNMIVAESRVDAQRVRKMLIDKAERDRLSAASSKMAHAPIWLDETPSISLVELRGKVRRLVARHGVQLAIVDYLQLMTASAIAQRRSREQEVSEISRGLKALAKELHIPVVALAQLSRRPEGRSDTKPVLSDLRESGAIEQDADVVMFLHRPEYYQKENTKEEDRGVAEVIVAKQRNGPTDKVRLAFLNEILRFENLAAPAFGGDRPL